MGGIELRNLSKVFGNVKAVDKVSLKVEEGEFLTLLGPSGCGKTTTLRMIAGLEKQTTGQIYMGEKEVTNLPPYKRNIGMVFQNLALFPHLTVFGNIAYGMRANRKEYTKKEIRDRVKEMLELVELPGMENRYPSQLSGGQQQRVALARALAFNPQVLLLDEPLVNLDRKLRERMQVELRRIQQKVGITTIFVTHDQEEAMTMSDRVAIMEAGRLLQVGPPTEVYEIPNSIFVAGFIGIMNFFEGRVAEISGDIVTVECNNFKLQALERRKGVQKGERVTVAIRPEAVQFAEGGEYTLSGKIDLKRHLGDTIEYHIYSDQGKEIIAIQPRRGVKGYNEGESVRLFLPKEDCLLFKAP
ncbi:MAG: ABC transporter ATP-binding protein [Candidatus Methanomethylicaceae archaeon]